MQRDLARRGAPDQLQRGGDSGSPPRRRRGSAPGSRAGSSRWSGFSASSLNSGRRSARRCVSTPPRNSTIIRPMTSEAASMSSSANGTPSISAWTMWVTRSCARVAAALVEQVDEVVLDARGGRLGHRGEAGVVGLAVLQLVHPALQLARGPAPDAGSPIRSKNTSIGSGQASSWARSTLAAVPPGVDSSRTTCADYVLALGDPPRQQAAAARSGGSGRAAGCRCRAGSPGRSGPWRCRRCRCPRS